MARKKKKKLVVELDLPKDDRTLEEFVHHHIFLRDTRFVFWNNVGDKLRFYPNGKW